MAASSPTRALLRRGSLYSVVLAIQLASSILVLPLVTRLVAPAEYGRVAIAVVVTKIVAVLAAVGIPAAITVEAFRRPDGDRVAAGLVSLAAATAVVVGVAGTITAPWWSGPLGDGRMTAPAALAVATGAAMAVQVAGQSLLQARDQVGRFVAVAVVATAGAQVCGLAAVLIGDRTATRYLAGVLAANAVAAVLTLVLAGAASPARARERWRPALGLALPTVPHSAALFVMAAGDRLVIGALMTTAAVGRYDIAYNVGAISLILLTAFNQAWAPQVYGSPEDERWSILAATTATVQRVFTRFAVAASLAAPVGLAVVAPGSYRTPAMTTVASLLPIGSVVYVVYLSRVHVVFQERRTSILAWSTPVATAVAIGACVVLVDTWGIVGAAVATVLGYVVQAALVSFSARSLAVVPWDHRAAAGAALLGSVGVAIAVATPDDGVFPALRLVVGAMIALDGIRLARKA